MRQRVRPLLLRLDDTGGFHVWSPRDGAFASIAADGAFAGVTSLPASDRPRVIDYAAGADRFYLLLGNPAEVRCVARSGAAVWTREVTTMQPDRLVTAGDALFLSGKSAAKTLLELRAEDGNMVREHTLRQGVIRLFAASDALVSSTFFKQQRRRGVLVYVPATRAESSSAAGPELFGPLLSAFGADRERNLYVYGTARGDATPAIFEVGPDAAIVRSEPLESVLVGTGGHVHVIVTSPDAFQVTLHRTGDGEPRTTRIERPAALGSAAPDRVQVVGVADGRLLVDVLDTTGSFEKRFSLDLATGSVEDVRGGDSPAVHGPQPVQTWQVAPDGGVFIPVSSDEGLAIIRVAM